MTGGGLQEWSLAYCALMCPFWRGRGKGAGGRWMIMGRDPLLIGRGGGPRRLYNEDGSRWCGMQDAGTMAPWMHQWVSRKRVITALLFTYPQVREYGSCHFCARRMEMRLSVASALTPKNSSTKATKGVKCLHLFKNSLRYFLLTCSSPRLQLFLHALSFECTSKLCINFLNQFLVYFHKACARGSQWND